MDLLQWQQTDRNQFAVFIRDLSQNINNVKHMIEDSFQNEEKPTQHRKGKHKKVVKKKKDIIIEQQNKVRLEKNIKEDLSKLDYIITNLDIGNPYPAFQLMKTSEGLHELKFRMLLYFWSLRKDHFPHVMNLYFQLVDKDITDPDKKALILKIQSKLEDTEYKLYMMKNLSHLLPPLNIHEPRIKKLDDWQIQVVTYIKQGESVIVKAPTSAGKSFVGLSAGVLHKKLLYVCPAKPIAYQVGAHFNLMGYKVHYLLDNLCHQGYDDKTNIFVGVPSTIEDNLYKLGVTFDYAVFDEIHNLNKEDDGHIYENILKLIRCPFLALSATIGNIEYLQEILTKIHTDDLTNAREDQRKKTLLELGDKYELNTKIHYVEYTKRFINQQKMVYDNGLHRLHPLACISFEDLNDSFLRSNLQFTPYDSAILWETIEDVFGLDLEEIVEDYSPDNYFDDDYSILTLDDTRSYEQFIKCKLVQLSLSHPDQIKEVLDVFHRDRSILRPVNPMKDIIQLFRECKVSDCLPMLVFNTDTIQCKKLFTQLFKTIEDSELDEFPFHYDILEKKDELYTKYEEKRILFIDNIKINKNSKDAHTDKQTKVDRYDKTEQQRYMHDVLNYYDQCIHNCARNDTISDSLRKIQIKNLTREMKSYQKYPSFGSVDVFQKHKEFCFTNSDPMTGDQIRQIRRDIKKTLGIKISYEHELFQMLKRGIGIYTEDMPDEYKWILQRLMDDKKIGIVISDRTLCLGIDLPIRSSCLLGLPGHKKFTIDDYLQMSGRAGRRGKDDRGNTIFYNLDYIELMKGQLPDIVGSEKEVPINYQCFNSSIDDIHKNPINYNKITDTRNYQESSDTRLQWSLRYEGNVYEFIQGIPKWNKNVFQGVGNLDKELCVLKGILLMCSFSNDALIQSYKKKVIDKEFREWKHVIKLLQIVYNSLRDKRYIHLKKNITTVHTVIKDMVLKYQGLN